jgi:hypothetical protein
MGIKREADYIPAREQKRLRAEAAGEDDDDQHVPLHSPLNSS